MDFLKSSPATQAAVSNGGRSCEKRRSFLREALLFSAARSSNEVIDFLPRDLFDSYGAGGTDAVLWTELDTFALS